MRGQQIDRDELLLKLVDVQYERNDIEFARSKFRVRGDCVELWPSYEEFALRIEFFGDEVDRLSYHQSHQRRDDREARRAVHLSGQALRHAREPHPGGRRSHQAGTGRAADDLKDTGKLLEAQRLNARTRFDIEMMLEVGYCPGIENYSRPLSGRPPGSTPDTLFDYFPKDFLMFVDESHVTVPQIRGMFAGDFSRKSTLVEHGFRLAQRAGQSAAEIRRMGTEARPGGACFGHAGPYELAKTGGEVVEQLIRPTGLLDPVIEVVPARGQVPHLLEQIQRACGRRRTRAGDHAHQAASRGPVVLPLRAGRDLQVAAQRTRRLRARRAAARSARPGISTLWSA